MTRINMQEKKIPLRMCIACKEMHSKRELIRIVKNKNGDISLDFTGKANGRGAYICNSIECIEKCIKTRALNRAFKEEIPEEVYENLREQYAKSQD